jgi:glycerol uptake facilitator-like aquaporin
VLLTRRQLLAEFLGTALLVVAVVGSGIAAARLSRGDLGVELLENAVATGTALVAIILALGPVSGAHLNPVITAVDRLRGGISTRVAVGYWAAQVAGGAIGAVLANLMFTLPAVELARHARSGSGQWLAEAIATFGLILVVFGLARAGRGSLAPFAVGAYITGAYFFNASTGFANPAVTIGRMFSNTFTGIAPASVPAFVGFQFLGGAIAAVALGVLYPEVTVADADVVLPHPTEEAAA